VKRRALTPLALSLLALLSGCPAPEQPEPALNLYAASTPPPGLEAHISRPGEPKRITLTTGSALAVSCWDNCPKTTTCSGLQVEADGRLLSAAPVWNNRHQPTQVLIAHLPGTTTLRMRTDCAESEWQVKIEPPPVE
jgi:hypothetical protein